MKICQQSKWGSLAQYNFPINLYDFADTKHDFCNSNTNTYRGHNPSSYGKTSTSSISDSLIRRVVKKNKCQVGNIFRKRYFLLYRGVFFIRRFIIWLEGWEWLLKRNAQTFSCLLYSCGYGLSQFRIYVYSRDKNFYS